MHSGFLLSWIAVMAAALAAAPAVTAQTQEQQTRGELLYNNHCIACHTTQVHWRDKRLVKDWASLQGQVFRWQNNIGLGWTVEDVNEVARFLNTRYYRLGEPGAASKQLPARGDRQAPAVNRPAVTPIRVG